MSAEARSVLILPDTDIDLSTWTWGGNVVTNIGEFEQRWREPLLDANGDLAVLLSLPSSKLEGMTEEEEKEVRQVWEREKTALAALFSEMRDRLHIHISDPIDLTDASPQVVSARLKTALARHPQILGIAHVPEPQCECSETGHPGRRPSFFEFGKGVRVDAQLLRRLADEVDRSGSQPRRAMFFGCATASTELPQDFIASNLSVHFLANMRTVHLQEMLVFLRALLIQGYAREAAKNVLNTVWSSYVKLLGYMSAARLASSGALMHPILLLEGAACRLGDALYYVAKPCRRGGIPHLEAVAKAETFERVRALVDRTDDAHMLVIDTPVELRTELGRVLSGRPVVWVAAGSTCGSVGEALFQIGVEYHLGYVQTTSTHLIHRFLRGYVCVSVCGTSAFGGGRVLPRGISAANLRHFLTQLSSEARDHLVVVGAEP